MSRSWLDFVAVTVFFAFGAVASTASANHGGFGGGSGHQGGSGVRQATMHGPLGNHTTPVKIGKPGNGGISPTKPTFPSGPVVGPIKPTGPTGPIKPPVVGPVKPPVGPIKPPIGPIGPIKPPVVGPVGPIGPVKPPIGPIGPVKPPKGPVVGPVTPPVGPVGPVGPVTPPGGGTTPPHCGGKVCKPWWPPVVIGCVPCVGAGAYYGGYYPPVYTQTVVVPAATTTIVAEQPAVSTVVATTSPEKLPQVPVGSTVTLNAKDLGASGQALLVIDKLTLGVHIDEWAVDHATATLPQLSISSPTAAQIVLVKADGYAASTVNVQLVPAPPAESETLGAMASLTR